MITGKGYGPEFDFKSLNLAQKPYNTVRWTELHARLHFRYGNGLRDERGLKLMMDRERVLKDHR